MKVGKCPTFLEFSFFPDFCTVCRYCASWASLSECSSNPAWMLPHCPIACGLCDLCEDFNQYCGAWAGRGECSRNNKYMDIYCKKVATENENVSSYCRCFFPVSYFPLFSRAECVAAA